MGGGNWDGMVVSASNWSRMLSSDSTLQTGINIQVLRWTRQGPLGHVYLGELSQIWMMRYNKVLVLFRKLVLPILGSLQILIDMPFTLVPFLFLKYSVTIIRWLQEKWLFYSSCTCFVIFFPFPICPFSLLHLISAWTTTSMAKIM